MSGGGIPTTVEQRLQQLERDNGSMRRLLEQLASRSAAVSFPRHIWIAKTADDGEGYPAAGNDTFGIIFQDGSYTRESGSPSPTYANRSADVLEYAKSLAGNYYVEGSYVAVFEEDRQYWIADSEAAPALDSARMSSSGTQTLTTGPGFEEITFSSETDSGGGITADQANNKIVITEDGTYLHNLTLFAKHAGPDNSNNTFRVICNMTVAWLNDAVQNPTFPAINLLGADDTFPVDVYTIATTVAYTAVSSDDLTIEIDAAGTSIDIVEAHWTVQKLF